MEIALSRRKLELKLEKAHERLEQTNLELQEEIEARKKTERTLLESQKLYRDIFEKNNAMKWLIDPSSGKIIDANPAACEFYQYSHEEITNLLVWDINMESEAEVRKMIASASSDRNTEFTLKHRLASGEIRDVHVYTGVLESGGKKLLHSIIIDITDRLRAEEALKHAHDDLERRVEIRTAELAEANKQLRKENEAHQRAVEALRESEEKLNAILDATTETIVLIDKKGIVHVANKTVCDRLATTKEKIVGKKLYDFFPPDVAEGRRQKWNKVFETGKPVFFEDSRAGMIFEQVAYPISGDGGQVEMIVSFAKDKTDRAQAERALCESEKHFHSFMESAKGFAVYRLKIDPENYYRGHLVFASPSLEDIVGVSPQEEFSQWFRNVHEDDLPSIINAQNESAQSGLPFDQEFRLRGLEGECRWLHVISNPVFNSEGKPECYNGIMIDVTTQKLMEMELQNKTLELSETNTALKILLNHREKDKEELGEKVLSNVKTLVVPYLKELKNSPVDQKQIVFLGLLESGLKNILSSFSSKLSSKYLALTPGELQIAYLVREGKRTKEIAELLNLSGKTIEDYRKNLRKKLGIRNTKVNLRTHLLSIQ